MSGAYTARDISPTPSTLSLRTMLAASSHDRNNEPESDHITVSIDVHTASCTRMSIKTCLQKRQNQNEWYDAGLKRRRSVEIEQSTVRISHRTKIVASTPRECPGKSEVPPTPDGSKLFPKR